MEEQKKLIEAKKEEAKLQAAELMQTTDKMNVMDIDVEDEDVDIDNI